jgi:hypothetical protein
MTDYEKFIKHNIHTTTIFIMSGDWSDKSHIIRKVNGFSEKAIITTAYDACEHKTTVTVKGV